MTQGVKITEHFAQRLASTVRRVDAMSPGFGDGKIPTRFEDRPAWSDGGSPIRLGQFTGPWSNDPPGNVKVVQLYKKHPTSSSPSAWIPDEGNVAVTVNLFSYIPTPRGGPTYRWAALVKVSDGSYTYQTGSYTNVDGVDVPDTATATSLWLLISAQC